VNLGITTYHNIQYEKWIHSEIIFSCVFKLIVINFECYMTTKMV